MKSKPLKDRVVTFLIGTAVGAFGTLSSLYVVHWFVAVLPGPQVMAEVRGFRGGTTPNTAGCVYYTLMILSDQPIDYVYMKAQFPEKINNYKVGLPQEAHMITGSLTVQAWAAGKNPSGDCAIKQSAVNDSADIQASAAGNMISIHAGKLPAQTNIMGMVATTEGQSMIKPAPKGVYTEGEYEYSKLGQTVRKVLRVSDLGIVDANSKNPWPLRGGLASRFS